MLNTDDDSLFSLIATGDEAAFNEIFNRHFPSVHSHIKRIVRDSDFAFDLARWYEWKVEFRNYEQHAKITRTFCRRSTEKQALAELKQAGVNVEKAGDRIIIN